MARKEAVPKREREICYRLQDFRRATKIPRTTFALTVGISGERLASYELGRVPLRYRVFKAINQHFHIRLDWLMNGRGTSTSPRPFDDSQFAGQINEKDLLSVVYDTLLSQHSDPDKEDMDSFFFGPGGLEARLVELQQIVTNPVESKKLPKAVLPLFIDQMESVLNEVRKAVERDLTPEEKYRRAMQGRRKGKVEE